MRRAVLACIVVLLIVGEAQAESGLASHYDYGPTYCGDGKTLKPMSAAHRTLPCNTRVRVTRKDDGRSIIVTVRDRGPFVRGRIIDVSPDVAWALGFYGTGLAAVEVEVTR